MQLVERSSRSPAKGVQRRALLPPPLPLPPPLTRPPSDAPLHASHQVVLVDTDAGWRVVPLKKIGEHRKTLLAKGFQQAEDEGEGSSLLT